VKIQIPVLLYRLYDKRDVLLYIGITENLGARMNAHAGSQRWWGQVHRMTVEMLPDRAAAETAETVAIRAEVPPYNKAKRSPVESIAPPSTEAVQLFDGEVKWVRDGRHAAQGIAAELRAKIMAGLLADGTQLPSIPSFARDRGVPASTVQVAWRTLQSEGHTVSKKGNGVYVRAQLNGGTACSDGLRILEVAEVDPPDDIARILGGGRAIMRHHVILRDGKPVELRSSYYPLSIAVGTALAQRRKIKEGVRRLLAESGYPPREFTDKLSIRPPTSEEAGVLDLAPSIPIVRQFRTLYTDGSRPVEVSVRIKPGHLHELKYQQDSPHQAR
jgi:GntR family transcriptional regulator